MGEHPTKPGWYSDPDDIHAHQAYWDGTRWTGAIRPYPTDKTVSQQKEWYQNPVFLVLAVGLLLAMFLAIASDAEAIILVLGVVVALGSGFVAQYVASARGHTETWYFWLGLFLPIIGIVVAFASPMVGPRGRPVKSAAANLSASPTAQPPLPTQLAELAQLHDAGSLTDDEFGAAKRKLIESQDS